MDPEPQINVRCRTRKFQVNENKVQRICSTVLKSVGLPKWQVDVEFLAPISMRRLNRQFRQKDYSTDVLSFPKIMWKRPVAVGKGAQPKQTLASPWQHLGDIAICPQIAAKNADQLDHGLDRETGFLIVHGILHLCGHDHSLPQEEKRMLLQQRKLMAKLASGTGSPLWKGCIQRKRSA